MILLDTNVISELMKPDAESRVLNWLDQVPIDQVYTSSISKAEIEYGVAILPAGKRKNQVETMANQILDLFIGRVLPFDQDSTRFFADIKSVRKQSGVPISFADAQIASITMQHDLQLITRNASDFQQIDRLRLLNPWE